MRSLILCFILFMPLATLAADLASRTDSLLSSLYRPGLPGAVIGIVKNGTVVFKRGYGIADMTTKAPITSSTNFNICSMTKQFTAYAILTLEREGRLSLNDPLIRFFPGFVPRIAGMVTVRHLLTHSSGIVEHYDHVDRSRYTAFWDKDVLTALRDVDTLNFAPGSRYRYSNAAFCLLSLIIEQVSGDTYPEYLRKHVLTPVGMLRSKVIQPGFTIDERAYGYDCDNDTIRLADAKESLFFSTMGDGGLYTSMDDYLRWIAAIYDGTVLDPALTGNARSPQFPIDTARGLSYGFGWFVGGSGPAQVIYHTGSNGGFRTIVFTKPSEKYALIIFSNRTGIDLEDLSREINRIYGIEDGAFVKLESLIS
jgi:CubicO group peptidase (beta-lactamase class C family)